MRNSPDKTLRRVFADNLKAARKARGLSQESLAELSGLHRTYVGSVERGERNIALDNLERLAIALQIDVTELLSVLPVGTDAESTVEP